jgi:hypothetical protein
MNNNSIIVNTIILRNGHLERVAGIAAESPDYQIVKTVYSTDNGQTWIDYDFLK